MHRESNRTDRKNVQILRGAHRPIWTNIPGYSHNNTSIRGLGGYNIAGAIIPALMHRIPSELRMAIENPCTKTRIQPYGSKECANFKRGTRPIWTNIPGYSHNNTSVKTSFYFLLSNTLEVAPQSYQIRGLGGYNIAGAIIPALMHRIPSELRS
ncbi:hypothetical protein CK203_116873 [Vitis vinifera]|uniref:Uncharacterized protein n=1 Tax=Vitis vinifera TaxID=29760 RepID=A0A438C7Z2_VITVI|nr:hypothetical protein CK203_116873 [Vitis vinifera]